MPTPINQGDSFAFFIGDGSTTTFPLGFEYLDVDHVKVLLEGTLLDNPDNYSVVGQNVVFVVAPVNDADVRLVRVTNRDYDARLVDFRSYGNITEDEMDLNQKQIWFLIQEAMETDDSGNVNPNAEYISWDAIRERWTAARGGLDRRIGDVDHPQADDDVATKLYVDSIAEWGIAGVPQGWTFTTTALGTTYTLTNGPLINAAYLIVAIDGVLQVPFVDFTVQQGEPNSTLQLLGTPPAAGLTVNVMNFGKARYINVTEVGPNAVGTEQIQDGAVTTPKLADDSVTSDKILDGAVSSGKLGADAVSGANIADLSVGFEHLRGSAFTVPAGGGVDRVLKIREATGNIVAETVRVADIADWTGGLALRPLSSFAPATGDIDMGLNRIRRVLAPSVSTDAATKGYVDSLGSVGPKIDLLDEITCSSSPMILTTGTWTLFSSPPAWLTSGDYLFLKLVFSNWTIRPGNRTFIFLDSGTGWQEGYRIDSLQAPVGSQIVWSCYLSLPTSGATKPAVSSDTGIWPETGAGYAFGLFDGIQIRTDNTAINVGARCHIYGHRPYA